MKISPKLTAGRAHHTPSDSHETDPSIQAEQVVIARQLGDCWCLLVCGKPSFKKFPHQTLFTEIHREKKYTHLFLNAKSLTNSMIISWSHGLFRCQGFSRANFATLWNSYSLNAWFKNRASNFRVGISALKCLASHGQWQKVFRVPNRRIITKDDELIT